ncbi:DUF1963 domain-containing protein [Streptomyces sp. NPDC054796]
MRSEVREKLDRFRRAALAHDVPSAEVERWLEAARPCAMLSPHVDGPVVGHFGGPLTLPAGADVPEDLDRMHLIASLDLAALSGDATGLPLPHEGRLLLLAHPDAMDPFGTAIYVPAGAPVEEHPVEYDYSEIDVLAGLDPALRGMGELRLRYDVSLPDYDSIPGLDGHPHARELREAWREVRDADLPLTKWSQVQIGGYAVDGYDETDPVRSAAYDAEEEADRPESEEPPRPEDWTLLAQWKPAIEDWEAAEVYWSTARQDMAARRFDRTQVSMFYAP